MSVQGFFLFLLLPTISLAQGKTLIASLHQSNCEEKTLSVYRYDSPFRQELIATKKTINGTATFLRPDAETDAYILEDASNKLGVLFFWDENILIDVNCEKAHESVIHNSPETTEFKKTERLKYNLSIVPLKMADSLLAECQALNKLNAPEACKALVEKRDQTAIESRKIFDAFILNYIKENPESFTSLYYLTIGGRDVPTEKAYREAFKEISNKLKGHRRSSIYTSYVEK